MPTYTIKYLDTTVASTTDHPLPLVDEIDDPPPSANYSNYKHDSKTAMEITTPADTVAFTIDPPSGALGDQTAAVSLTTVSLKKTIVEWSAPGSTTIRLDVKGEMDNTKLDLIRAEERPLVKLKVTVKKP
jgi:hypothetical protein